VFSVLLGALRAMRASGTFDVGRATATLFQPARAVDWVDVVGGPVAGVVMGFAVAAYLAARRGVARQAA
jgi:PAT family beta-lactamase induction signal transducer AmpG